MTTRREFLGGNRGGIASAVVYSLPGRQERIRGSLSGLPGVEIHRETADGRFVVTVEDSSGGTTGDTLLALHNLEGVSAVALIAHYEDV